MKYKIKFVLLLFHFLFFSFNWCCASGAGTHGMDFLKLKLAARQLAMGNAFVAVADDVNTQLYNPSGLVNLAGQELTFTNLAYIEDINYMYIGYGIPGAKKKGATSFGFSLFQNKIEETDIQCNRIGDLMTTGMVWSVCHARKIGKNSSFGLELKEISYQLGDYSANTLACDIGGYHEIPATGFSVGFAVENWASKYSFIEEEESIAVNYKLGVAQKFREINSILALDIINSENKYYYNLGLEQRLMKIISLRAGYKLGYDLETYSLGAGINCKAKWLDEIQFDYVFLPMGELGNISGFSLVTRF